jgi:ribosomal protein L7/L12
LKAYVLRLDDEEDKEVARDIEFIRKIILTYIFVNEEELNKTQIYNKLDNFEEELLAKINYFKAEELRLGGIFELTEYIEKKINLNRIPIVGENMYSIFEKFEGINKFKFQLDHIEYFISFIKSYRDLYQAGLPEKKELIQKNEKLEEENKVLQAKIKNLESQLKSQEASEKEQPRKYSPGKFS